MMLLFKSDDGKCYETKELCLAADRAFKEKNEAISKEKEDRSKLAKELEELERKYLESYKQSKINIAALVKEFEEKKHAELAKLEEIEKEYHLKLSQFLAKYGHYYKTVNTTNDYILFF